MHGWGSREGAPLPLLALGWENIAHKFVEASWAGSIAGMFCIAP